MAIIMISKMISVLILKVNEKCLDGRGLSLTAVNVVLYNDNHDGGLVPIEGKSTATISISTA